MKSYETMELDTLKTIAKSTGNPVERGVLQAEFDDLKETMPECMFNPNGGIVKFKGVI